MPSTSRSNGRSASRSVDSKPVKVSLNLDAATRAAKKPFVVTVAGRNLELIDVNDSDWQELEAAARNPIEVLKHAMSTADFEYFVATKMPAWKIEMMFREYAAYFELTLGSALDR